MVMQACKLNLPHSHSSLEVTSLLFEPFSHSLALMHSDASILLFPSFSLFPSSPSPSPQTLIPPISTDACFLRLHSNNNNNDDDNTRVLLVVAGPHSGGSRILLRFWTLRNNNNNTGVFVKAQVNCNQKDLICDDKLGGIVVDLFHGFSVKLAGSVNLLALYSVSARQIWIFAAKMVNDHVSMTKCAVINCTLPVCSITVSMGLLLLGEENGVRVFPLRPLVKGVGEPRKQHDRDSISNPSRENATFNSHDASMSLPNGGQISSSGSNDLCYSGKAQLKRVSAKLRTVKLTQDSGVGGMFFAAFKSLDVQIQKSKMVLLVSLKVVSIHAVSQKKFLILDSIGDLHLLSLYSNALGSEITGHMRPLSHTMKVLVLAVLPETRTSTNMRKQTVWVSDGLHSVHIMSVSDMDITVNENDKSEIEEKPIQISAIQAIFASEKIQDLIPLSANAILILGQGNIFAYSTS